MRVFVFLLASLLLLQDAPVAAYAGDGEDTPALTLRQVLSYISRLEGCADYADSWLVPTGASAAGVDAPYFLVFKVFNYQGPSSGSYKYHVWTFDTPVTLTVFKASEPRILKVMGAPSPCFSVVLDGSGSVALGSNCSMIDCRGDRKGEVVYTNIGIDTSAPYDPGFIRLTPDDDLLGSYAPTPSPAPQLTPAPTPTAGLTSVPTPKPTATPTPVPVFPTRQPTPTPTPLPAVPGGDAGDGTATGCALCVGVLLGISAKFDAALWHLECVAALLLILVVFGTMRVVSRWSKGVNVK